MSKKLAAPSVSAAELVAKWRELAADAQAKHAAYLEYAAANPFDKPGEKLSNEGRLRLEFDYATRELVVAEAKECAAVAERAAVLALDAEELAEGDEVARGRDLPTLREDLVAIAVEVAAAETALIAAKRRTVARVRAAQQAELVVSARRRAADLPYAGCSYSFDPARPLLLNIDEAIARGIQMPGSRAAQGRNDIRRLAFKLEEIRIEREADEKEAARAQRNKVDNERRAQDQAHADDAARQRKADEEQQKREALADAYLNRRAGGAAQ
jgi:hypothetical protein